MASSIAVIRLEGELEIGRKADVAAALRLNGGESAVLLDFSGVTYADSTTLAELLRFRNEAAERDVAVAILVGNRQFARLVKYAGLADAFRIFDDRASALTELARVPGP